MQPGTIIDGRFALESIAGRGGMGIVYRAKDIETQRYVAVKVLPGNQLSSQRFERESRILASLSHPGIVSYIAHGQLNNQPYLVMEWLEGEDLSTRLSRGSLSLEESLLLLGRLADALSAAHGQGIIHRDIKPSNIFLPNARIEEAKLLDFGIARDGGSSIEITQTGVLMGTPGYLAPEQATRGAKHLEPSADVFSLGCVFFECVTGRAAFFGENALAVLSKILLEEAPRLSAMREHIPASVDELSVKMLSKDPANRPIDGAALLRSIQALTTTSALRAERSVLTHHEQRLVSIILVELDRQTGERLAFLSTQELQQENSTISSLRERSKLFGGEVYFLVDGTLLVAFSGAGVATDQALRAGRCALELRELFPEVKICMATGGGETSAQRVPIGEVLDRASKQLLEALFAPAGIRVDEATAGLLQSRFQLEKDSFGYLFTTSKERSTKRLLLGKSTSCVGRERELFLLESAFDYCANEEKSKAVLVTASAGIGKSRLREEILQRIERRGVRPLLFAQGDPLRAGAPFGLLGPALGGCFGLRDGDPKEVYYRIIHQRVSEHLKIPEAERVTAFLCELLHAPVGGAGALRDVLLAARRDPQLMADQTLRAFLDWLRAECGSEPVLLVLEDLHWGDLPTIKFIDSALRSLASSPLMILAFARPEVHEVFPGLWASRDLEEIRLSEISKKAAERLIKETLGAAEPSTIKELYERSGGNAFYLEELIRAFHQDGATGQLPQTVLAMARARLESLPDEARRALRAASVFGERFWSGAVAALSGDEPRAIRATLRSLVESEVLVPCEEARLPKEEELRFRHSFLQEAAYAALTKNDKILGHRLAARWLLSVGERSASVIAEHFERGEERSEAISHYLAAANQALDGNDLQSVIALSERAFGCGATGEVAGEFHVLLMRVYLWRGEIAPGSQHTQKAMALLPRGSRGWLGAAESIGFLHLSTQPGDPSAFIRSLAELQVTDENRQSYVITTARNAVQMYIKGPHSFADELHHMASTQAKAEQDHTTRAVLSMANAFQACVRGDLSVAIRQLEASAQSYDAAGDQRNAASQRVDAELWRCELGDTERALQNLNTLAPLVERLGLDRLRALASAVQIRALLDLERPQEALAALDKMPTTISPIKGAAAMYRSGALILLGSPEEAEQEAKKSLEIVGFIPRFQATTCAFLSDVYLALHRYPEAVSYGKKSIETSLSIQGFLGTLEAKGFLAHLKALLASGLHEEAKQAAKAAKERLLLRASKISDESDQAIFLQRAPTHQKIMALASELGV